MFNDRLTGCMTVFYYVQLFLSAYFNEIDFGTINDKKSMIFEIKNKGSY